MNTPFAIGSKLWPGLSKLIEESGEVQQIIGKLIATGGETNHWFEGNLALRIEEELGDLLAAIDFVLDHNPVLNRETVAQRYLEKKKRFNSWHENEIPLPEKTNA